jgi:prephenate dehydrogenase
MAKTKITIVGLGLVGRSIGFALAEGSRDYTLMGHDKEPKSATAARKAKAVDGTEWNLLNACDGADLIVLALPITAIRDTLQVIAEDLKPGTMLIDTASLKEPVLRWADEILPDNVDFVGGDPVIATAGLSADDASAKLLEGAIFSLCPSVKASPNAVRLASGFVERLGAEPYFIDAAEHDGLLAAVEQLPALLAAALITSTTNSSSWRDMRRMAGGQYEGSTSFASETPSVHSDACLYNQQNLTRWIDYYIQELVRWKETIASDDADRVQAAFAEAMTARLQWLNLRASGRWEDSDRPETPARPGFLSSMFGFGGRSAAR